MSVILKRKFDIPCKEDFKKDVSRIIRKLEFELKEMDFQVELKDNTILFHRIIRTTTNSAINKIEHSKIIRNGKIVLKKNEKGDINIEYKVDIGAFLALSIGLGLVLGLCAKIYFEIELLSGLILACFLFGIIYCVGYIIIEQKLISLFKRCIYINKRTKA